MQSALNEEAIAAAARERGLSRLEAAANALLVRAQANAPKDSGSLKQSGFVKLDKAEGIAYVGFKAFYAKWIEYGFVHSSGKHIGPKPFLRKALAEGQTEIEGILAGDETP